MSKKPTRHEPGWYTNGPHEHRTATTIDIGSRCPRGNFHIQPPPDHPGCDTCNVGDLRVELNRRNNRLATLQETVTALSAQVMRLGQCVECGEMDEQDGTRLGGKFYCTKHVPEVSP